MNFSRTIGSIPDGFVVKGFPDAGISMNGSMLRLGSSIFAAWLQENAYRTVGIHMGNCPEFMYLFAGALRAGVKVMLFNVLKDADDTVPVVSKETAADILDAAGCSFLYDSGIAASNSSRTTSYRFSEYEWEMDEPFVMLTTSGTCGKQKTAEKSLRIFLSMRVLLSFLRTADSLFNFRIYNCSPWYHNTGLFFIVFTVLGIQFTEYTTRKFNPSMLGQYLDCTKPVFLMCTPTMLARSLQAGDSFLPPIIVCTGERLSSEAISRLDDRCSGHILFNSYGTTEAGTISFFLYTIGTLSFRMRMLVFALRRFGMKVFCRKDLPADCAGKIMKNVNVKIIKDGVEQPQGKIGEITVSTKMMLAELEGDYFYTGDQGYIEGDLLFIVGRSPNVINRSGEKIIPSEIEHVVMQFDGVRSVTVFGIPSETHGEDICVAVECAEGQPVFEKSDLQRRLPKYMIPQHLLFLDKFPMTASGKTDLSAIMHSVAG